MSGVQPQAGTAGVVAGSGVAVGQDWREALGAALDDALRPLGGALPSLLVVFASDAFSKDFDALLREASERSGALELVGNSGSAVIGGDQELEGEPAVSVLALRFPVNAFVSARHVTREDVRQVEADGEAAASWPELLGLQPAGCTGLIVLADPFTTDPDRLVDSLQAAYPGVTIVGGLASAAGSEHKAWVFHGSRAEPEGAVVVGLGGSVALQAVVSQGAEPIGQPWTITDVDGYLVRRIGNRRAYEVLVETLNGLEERTRRRAARNLLVGLALDEYRDAFQRGDFLIRNLMGADPASGAIAVGALPRVGQTLQFQVRDAEAADQELQRLLAVASAGASRPSAALLFACNGRGKGLFGAPHHDARTTQEVLGGVPLAGFFCNGEIGPVGTATYLHGFTASLGLVVPTSPA